MHAPRFASVPKRVAAFTAAVGIATVALLASAGNAPLVASVDDAPEQYVSELPQDRQDIDNPADDAIPMGCSGKDSCVLKQYCVNLCGSCGILSSETSKNCNKFGKDYVQCTCKLAGSGKNVPKPNPKK